MEKQSALIGKANRFGGKLVYRTVSLVPLAIGLFSATAGWHSFQSGALLSAAILFAIAALGLLAVKWCWSPKRTFEEFLDANS